MKNVTLYRKYRPKSFSDVVGQDHITKVLQNVIDNNAFSHAYLFSGPHGVGKTSIARIFAHLIVDMPYSDEDTPLDIIEIDAASNRRIDEIRSLKERVNLAPINSKHKVYIIDEVHMLTKEAFNALLKTLEEPPSHVVFILATTEASSLPATIVSRTQRHNFKNYTTDQLVKQLSFVAKKEKMTVQPEDLELIARHANGSMRDSLSVLGKVQQVGDDISSVIGVPSSDQVTELFSLIDSHKIKDSFIYIEKLVEDGFSVNEISKELINFIMDNDQSVEWINLAKDMLRINLDNNPMLAMKVAISDHFRSREAPIQPPETTRTPDNVDIKAEDTTGKAKEEIKDDQKLKESIDEQKNEVTKVSVSDKEFWSSFMAELKQSNRQAYTVLRMVENSKADNQLELTCKFDLHYKKVNDPSFKAALLEQLEKYGVTELKVSKNTKMANATIKGDADATIKDIMGGGETVKLGSTV